MKHPPIPPDSRAVKIIVRGIHVCLTPALHSIATEKADRLLRHNAHIVRVRIDLEHDLSRSIGRQFVAKGHIEIGGPDLIASVASEDCYKSLDLLIDKLDRLLLRRHGLRKDKRHRSPAVGLVAGLRTE